MIDTEKKTDTENGEFPKNKLVEFQSKNFSNKLPNSDGISGTKGAGLRTQVIAFAFAIGTIPVLLMGGITYQLVNNSTTKEINRNKEEKARLLVSNINRFILKRYEDMQILAKQISPENSKSKKLINRAQIETKLNDYVEIENSYESIAVFDSNGNQVAASKGQLFVNQKNEEYFRDVLSTKSLYISPSVATRDIEQAKISLAVPVKDSRTNETKYIIKASLPVKNLEKVFVTSQISQDEYYLVDATSKIFWSKNGLYLGKNIKEEIPIWQRLQAKNKIATSQVIDPHDNVEELVTYVPWQKVEGLPNLKWKLVLNTDVATAFAAQRQLLLLLAIGTPITALLVGGIGAIVASRFMRRIIDATTAVKKLGNGQLETRVDVKGDDEFALLGKNINQMANQLQNLVQEQIAEAEHLKLLTNVLLSIRSSVNSEELFQMAVREARYALKADRVVIYQFNSGLEEKVIAESVTPNFPVALGEKIEDGCIRKELIEAYRQGHVLATNNVYEAGFSPEHLRLMERLQIKANLIAPIIKDSQVFGFLIAHHCQKPYIWQSYEVNFLRQLAIQVGLTLERVKLIEITQILKDLAIHLSKTHNSQEIYDFAVENIQKALKADRAVVYKIDENCQGKIIAESVVKGYPVSLNAEIYDPCLQNYLNKYRQGRAVAINDIYQAGFSECYIQQLEPFAVKANLIAPILLGDKFLGLLIAHQCSQPRLWEQFEIDLFEQFARIVGLALERANLLEEAEKGRYSAERVSHQQRQQKERLQLQLLKLIDDVEIASKGDLTVRAEVTQGEIGTVADFFNSILESLRDIVSQVKIAATEVNAAIAENSGAMNQLTVESLKQAREISYTLDAVDQMRSSIQAVSKSAQQAADVAHTAYRAAETGDAAMDLTVENIMSLRETIGITTKKVKRLGESSQQIYRVVGLINQIAMQTNLLAINTGIEAARAGEDAHGFAVIAEEVAVLAAQCGAATSEIEEIVANIQLETTQVVKAMELGTTQVVEGTRLVQNTKQSLNHILDVCREIDQLVHSISDATVSQVQTSTEVSTLMQDVAKVAEMTSTSSRAVSSSLQKTVEISQRLQDSVRTFKVS